MELILVGMIDNKHTKKIREKNQIKRDKDLAENYS